MKNNLRQWLQTLPNKLTFGRIAAIPILILLFPFDVSIIRTFCAIIFGIAASTDFFDGYLARRYNGVTRIGALLDPISDKLLVTSAVILLTNAAIIPAWIAILIICREIAVSGLRLAAMEKNLDIAVNHLGKWKTAFQDLSIGVLMSSIDSFFEAGMVLMWISIILSYYSGYLYWVQFWKKDSPA